MISHRQTRFKQRAVEAGREKVIGLSCGLNYSNIKIFWNDPKIANKLEGKINKVSHWPAIYA